MCYKLSHCAVSLLFHCDVTRFTDVLEVLQAIATHPDQSVKDALAVGMCELKLVYFMILYFLEVAWCTFHLECRACQLPAL